ncbi:MAG: M15 family metallopeptidase [Weeksellaceae bacterium]
MYNRREFIKGISWLGVSALMPMPVMALDRLSHKVEDYSIEDLMGKSKAPLYGNGYNLRFEASEALKNMLAAASKDGFKPYVVSSYRSYNHQKRIWDNKYNKFTKSGLSPEQAIAKIIQYSTIPGTSRHHWGTDFDIIASAKNIPSNPLNEKHFNMGGPYYEFKLWLNDHAKGFGFYEVYTDKPGRKGFEYEPWHFSYAPTSCEMFKQYLDKEVLGELYGSNIAGAKYLTQEFLTQYLNENLLDINPELIP